MPRKQKTALIDGDIVVFRCSTVFDTPTEYFGNGLYQFDESSALENAKAMCNRIVEESGCYDGLICFSSRENFRKDVLPSYKGNRVSRKPIQYTSIKEGLVKWSTMRTLEKPRLEGDDVIGILATGKLKDQCVICSIDKDLLTIPGFHLNFDDDFGSVVEVTPEEADRYFWSQVISGDRTDGYAGAPGFGPVKAGKFLDECESTDQSLWQAIVDGPYEGDSGLALTNARCARILRHDEFDYHARKPILWSPENA